MGAAAGRGAAARRRGGTAGRGRARRAAAGRGGARRGRGAGAAGRGGARRSTAGAAGAAAGAASKHTEECTLEIFGSAHSRGIGVHTRELPHPESKP